MELVYFKLTYICLFLFQVYGGTNVTAVDHLCLGIPRGECFGLLGINGEMAPAMAKTGFT